MNELTMPAQSEPIGFAVSPRKLLVMHIFTLGLYDVYWAYKNFANLNYPGQNKIGWAIFSIFVGLSLYGILQRFNLLAAKLGQPIAINSKLLAVLYILCFLLPNLFGKDVHPLIQIFPGILAVIPLYVAQVKINELNTALRPGLHMDRKFSTTDLIGIAIGAILWIVIIVGSFLPDDDLPLPQ